MSNTMYWIAVVFAFGLCVMATAQNHCRPKDCYDLRCYRLSGGKDGPHIIYPDTAKLPSLEVACDQETDNGGWIMYQRRVDGTLNFTRNWEQYKHRFGTNGDNTTELWLGNENVYQLLQSYGNKVVDLRIEVDTFYGDLGWIESSSFTMRNEAALYSMNWATTTASTTLMAREWDRHKTHSFKTYDKFGSRRRCLKVYKGGWWYRKGCSLVRLNGEYIKSAKPVNTSIYIQGFSYMSLKRSRMMFRMTNVTYTCDNPCRNGATCVHVSDRRGHLCVCKYEYCGAECEMANPCKNGGACQYDETTKSTTCICSAAFCGPKCELANPCKNDGTCEYDETMKSTTCKCSAEFVGLKCEHAVTTPPTTPTKTPSPSTMPPTTPPTTGMPVVGGILLLLILFGICVAAGVICKRRQRKKQEEEEEEEKAKEEEANEKLKLAEKELSESGSFTDDMMSMFGF